MHKNQFNCLQKKKKNKSIVCEIDLYVFYINAEFESTRIGNVNVVVNVYHEFDVKYICF